MGHRAIGDQQWLLKCLDARHMLERGTPKGLMNEGTGRVAGLEASWEWAGEGKIRIMIVFPL